VSIHSASGEILGVEEKHPGVPYRVDWQEFHDRCEEAGYEPPPYIRELIRDYEVPVGMVSDGSSVPRPFWPVARPFGETLIAAILHDPWFKLGVDGRGRVIDRCTADDGYLYTTIADGVWEPKCLAMRGGLRVGSWVAWNRYRRLEGDQA